LGFYLRYLQTDHTKFSEFKYYIFDTYFYSALQSEKKDKKDVRNWTKNVDIFKYDYLLIPINTEAHWLLCAVCFARNVGEKHAPKDKPCIITLDSMNARSHATTIKPIRDFLKDEWKEKNDTVKEFKNANLPLENPKVPRQPNGTDCGYYTLLFVDKFCQEQVDLEEVKKSLNKDWFEASEISVLRNRIKEIIQDCSRHSVANSSSKSLNTQQTPSLLPDSDHNNNNNNNNNIEETETIDNNGDEDDEIEESITL